MLLLAWCGAAEEELDARTDSMHRLREALGKANLRWGVVATPDVLRLVRAEGEGPRRAFVEVDLPGLVEHADPESFAAFLRLLSLSNFVPGADGRLPIDNIEAESRRHAEKVSEDLKRAVFEAAETLVAGLLADAEENGRIVSAAGLNETDLATFRDAALTALYRILFILYTEARDPRLDEHAVYLKSYSIHGLRELLLQDPAREWPQNRSGLWQRLLATFRVFDVGLRVLDPACGSAHVLVEAMRFMGRELHRAYVEELGGRPPEHFRPTTGHPGTSTGERAMRSRGPATRRHARGASAALPSVAFSASTSTPPLWVSPASRCGSSRWPATAP